MQATRKTGGKLNMYIWRNECNLIVHMNATLEKEGKNRISQLCSSLTNNEVKIQELNVRSINVNKSQKSKIFIATLASKNDVFKVLKNSFKLKSSDVSIQRDIPESMRKKRSNMLRLRKHIRGYHPSARIVVHNDVLKDLDANISFTWDSNLGLKISSGENPLHILKTKYNIQEESLNQLVERNNR